MAVVWARFHKQRVPGWLLSTNFLIVAPNVIVYQRLERDFAANRIFYELPLIPGVARRFQPKGDSAGRPRGARLVWQSLPHQHPPALRIARPGVNAAERHRGPPRQEAREGPRHLGAVLIFQFLTRFTGVPVAPGFCFMTGVGGGDGGRSPKRVRRGYRGTLTKTARGRCGNWRDCCGGKPKH
jgi:hypothetical protein